MSLQVALQLDHPAKLHPKLDTSLTLAYEAQRRGAEILYYQPSDLTFKEGKIWARAQSLHMNHRDDTFTLEEGPQQVLNLSTVDVVLMRQNPPFDMTYLTATYLLDHIADQALVLNNPTGVRNSVEKLLPLEFPALIPETLISQDWHEISEFCTKHEEVILKPLLDYGGHSVFLVKARDGQLKSLYQLLTRSYPGLPFIVQPFLKQVIDGDKRLIMINGEFIGGFKRTPSSGEIRANMLMGGTAQACDITERDLEICKTLGPRLRELGLYFAGVDVIGDYLIEINVTSPTGLVPLKTLTGIDGAGLFWDGVEKIIGSKSLDGGQYYHSSVSRN